MKHALVTGGAGFIGSHLIDKLLEEDWKVSCIDNFDPFYDRAIKEENIRHHLNHPNYTLYELDIRDQNALMQELPMDFQVVVHLAAKAGVRPSIQDPVTYQQVNVQGTQNLLELAKHAGCKQFVFASSSSVYGVNPNVPWHEDDHVLKPISPYAASKVAGELLGHVYSHLYDIRFIGLRFFTVYGPRQRPDLAIHKFARKILEESPIQLYGDGSTRRDYTYIDDIVQGIAAAMHFKASRYEVINLGNNIPTRLSELVELMEAQFGKRAKRETLPEQPGDVPQTYASIEKAQSILDYHVTTPFKDGMAKFHDWVKEKYIKPENVD